MSLRIQTDNPSRSEVRALLDEHLRHMHTLSPANQVFALDVSGLQAADVTFWTVWDGAVLAGCGALKALSATHGEVKSMRTPAVLRRRGAGRAILTHIIATARARGYQALSLETGTHADFAPAHALYRGAGFTACGPFGTYRPSANSAFMTLRLTADEGPPPL